MVVQQNYFFELSVDKSLLIRYHTINSVRKTIYRPSLLNSPSFLTRPPQDMTVKRNIEKLFEEDSNLYRSHNYKSMLSLLVCRTIFSFNLFPTVRKFKKAYQFKIREKYLLFLNICIVPILLKYNLIFVFFENIFIL